MKNLLCILMPATVKGLILEQAAQFFTSRLNVMPLVTMQISCYLRKFTGIRLPQLFQRITRSSSSVPHSVSCEGNKQPISLLKTANNITIRTLNVMKISFFPTGIRTVCPSSTPAIRKEKKEGMSPCVTTHVLLNTYNSCHPQKPATTAAPAHPAAGGTRPTSEQHSNTLLGSPGAVAKGRRCQHTFIPLR